MSENNHRWPVVPLGKLAAEMCLGKMLDKRKNRGTLQPYLRNVNVRWFSFDLSDMKEMRFEDDEETRFGLESGDLVICEGGEPGRAAVWRGQAERAKIQKALHRIRFRSDEYDPSFAMYYVFFGTITNRFAEHYTGTTIKHLTGKALSRVPFPVPPVNEQRRIVEKIEELFSDLDAGVAALRRAKANLKRYRASVLKAAVDGSLTAEWRRQHPAIERAAELLARILKERHRKWEEAQLAKFAVAGREPPKNWRSKYLEPTPPDTANLPDLPKGWCWASVEQICEVGTGTTPSRSNAAFYDGGTIPWIMSTAVNRPFVDEGSEFVTEKAMRETTLRLYPTGTLLIALYGEGRTRGMVSELRIEATINQALGALVFSESAASTAPFVKQYLNSRYMQLRRQAAGGMQPNLNLGLVKRIPVPLPPHIEQELIVDDVFAKLSQIEAAETAIDHGLRRAARIRQSILKQAFEGKLVAQDPADESASSLLARIQEARPAHRTKSKSKVATGAKKTESKGAFFRQAAVVSYAVRRLASGKSFGRTQLEKTLHLAQSHLGIDLEFEFVRQAAGPFDKAIYRIEGAARKNNWFATQGRKGFGVRYQPGSKIDTMCHYAEKYLGTNHAAFDQLLDHISKMNTDQAELFATTYAAWNDLLLDGRPATDDAIVAEVHGWHESKKRFDQPKITKCLTWMREHGYVPTGQGQHTRVIAREEQSLSPKRRPTGEHKRSSTVSRPKRQASSRRQTHRKPD